MQTTPLQMRDRTDRTIAAGMWIGLWIGEVLAAGEYWLARAGQVIRKPLLAVCCLSFGAGIALVMRARTDCCSQWRFATLDLKALTQSIELYRARNADLPARLEDLVPGYARDLHVDPWGHNYVLYRGLGGFAIVSAGPDGQPGTSDDIVSVGSSAITTSGK